MRNTKLVWIILLVFMGRISAQDPYLQGDPSPKVEAEAKELLQQYQPNLVMDSNQVLLFEKTLIEYLMRREKIYILDAPEKEKRYLLKKLDRYENGEMSNILTRPQLRYYFKIKRQLQPAGALL